MRVLSVIEDPGLLAGSAYGLEARGRLGTKPILYRAWCLSSSAMRHSSCALACVQHQALWFRRSFGKTLGLVGAWSKIGLGSHQASSFLLQLLCILQLCLGSYRRTSTGSPSPISQNTGVSNAFCSPRSRRARQIQTRTACKIFFVRRGPRPYLTICASLCTGMSSRSPKAFQRQKCSHTRDSVSVFS